MPNVCNITVVGNLGRDPELKTSVNGKDYTTFSVASNKAGAEREETVWFRCTVWGQLATWANDSLHKGSLVYVQGRFGERTYEGKDGRPGHSNEISVNELQLLDPRARDEEAAVGFVATASGDASIPF